ncbi:MAG: Ig domain-containing protein [Candidatus Krumholzibacteriia bacterium]
MRKVFTLFAGLVLLSMLAACSDDTTPTPPKPDVVDFEITTAAVPVAYTCSPYNTTLAVQGGTAPYTWTLAEASDPLPEGIVLTSDGKISGVMIAAGDFSFTVRVTDSSPTPESLDKAFDMNVDVASNPSLAVFFDGSASVCTSATAAWTPVNCYIFIMLDQENVNCAQATEFKLRIADGDNADLDPGSQYAIMSVAIPEHVAATIGDLFAGMALAFSRPMYGPEPILVASFDLLLLEDLQNLSFKFEANVNGSLGIASCEEGFPIVNVTGREAAINY